MCPALDGVLRTERLTDCLLGCGCHPGPRAGRTVRRQSGRFYCFSSIFHIPGDMGVLHGGLPDSGTSTPLTDGVLPSFVTLAALGCLLRSSRAPAGAEPLLGQGWSCVTGCGQAWPGGEGVSCCTGTGNRSQGSGRSLERSLSLIEMRQAGSSGCLYHLGPGFFYKVILWTLRLPWFIKRRPPLAGFPLGGLAFGACLAQLIAHTRQGGLGNPGAFHQGFPGAGKTE